MNQITNETQWPALSRAYATHVTDENGVDRPLLIENVTSVKDSFNLGVALSQGLVQGAYSPYMGMAKAGEIVILKIKLGRPDQDFRDIRDNNAPVASACLRVTQNGRVIINFARGISNRDLYDPKTDNSNSPLARAVMNYVADINERNIDLISDIGQGRIQRHAPIPQPVPREQQPTSTIAALAASAYARLRSAITNRESAAQATPAETQAELPDSETFTPISFRGENRVWPTITGQFTHGNISIMPVSDSRMLYELATRCENRMMWPDFFKTTENAILNGSVQVAAVLNSVHNDNGIISPATEDDIIGYACIQPIGGLPTVTQITSRLELPPTPEMREAAHAYARSIPEITGFPAYEGNRFPVRDGMVVTPENGRQVPSYDENGIMTLNPERNTFTPTPAPTIRCHDFDAPVTGIEDGITRSTRSSIFDDAENRGDDEDRDHVFDDDPPLDDVEVEESRLSALQAFNADRTVRLPSFLPTHVGDALVSVGSFIPFINEDGEGLSSNTIEVLKGNGHNIGGAENEGADINGLLDGTFLPVHIETDDGVGVDALVKVEGNDFYLIEATDLDGETWFTEQGVGLNGMENLLINAFTQVSGLMVERRDPNALAFEEALRESGMTPYVREEPESSRDRLHRSM